MSVSRASVALYFAVVICAVGAIAGGMHFGPQVFLFLSALEVVLVAVLIAHTWRAAPSGTSRVVHALVPLASGVLGLIVPAFGYLDLMAAHPISHGEWPWWVFLAIPFSAVGPDYPHTITFTTLVGLNVAFWAGMPLALAYFCRVKPLSSGRGPAGAA